jgi:sterol desaturase/sphingolipid hydroxylase (fatty acid hydroxylase superfamily)
VKIYPIVDLAGMPFLGAAALWLFAGERVRPLRRGRSDRAARRFFINTALAAGAFGLTRFGVIPVVVRVAGLASRRRFGIASILPLPGPLRAAVAFLAFDYSMYLWHRMNHKVPVLWRFHRVHHTDKELDLTTAFRFHAGEIAASVAFRAAQAAVVGAGPRTALLYEVCLEGATAFHHANIRLPEALERAINKIFVTPRMHTVHHSIEEREVSSNWSVIFSLWDRLHGTFSPPFPERAVTLGVPEIRDARELSIYRLLSMPFRKSPKIRKEEAS